MGSSPGHPASCWSIQESVENHTGCGSSGLKVDMPLASAQVLLTKSQSYDPSFTAREAERYSPSVPRKRNWGWGIKPRSCQLQVRCLGPGSPHPTPVLTIPLCCIGPHFILVSVLDGLSSLCTFALKDDGYQRPLSPWHMRTDPSRSASFNGGWQWVVHWEAQEVGNPLQHPGEICSEQRPVCGNCRGAVSCHPCPQPSSEVCESEWTKE